MTGFRVSISSYSLIKKILPGDPFWKQFNSSFENKELTADMILQSVYDGYPMTTWHSNHWRTGENFICGQFIGLDFDTEDNRSRLSTLLQDKFISRYAAFIHTTISHTDEAPRARVIFTLDTPIQQAKNYVLAASALLWLFGTADRACRDAVRFWYGAKGCECEYISQVLPIEIIKKLIANYQETGAKEKRKSSRSDYQAPASQYEVAEALKFIPPWQVDYDEWLSILMALHSQFGDAGYSLAESWGDGKQGEIEQKWKSFKPQGNETGAITIATVFGIAKKFGWRRLN